MMKKPEWPFVIVNWLDSSKESSTWLHIKDAVLNHSLGVTSCGWMYEDKPEFISLCASKTDIDKDGDLSVGEVTHIPRCCIKPGGIHTFDIVLNPKPEATVVPFENPNE